jgi:hypothetical protein
MKHQQIIFLNTTSLGLERFTTFNFYFYFYFYVSCSVFCGGISIPSHPKLVCEGGRRERERGGERARIRS